MSTLKFCNLCGSSQNLLNYHDGINVCVGCDYCSWCAERTEPLAYIPGARPLILCSECLMTKAIDDSAVAHQRRHPS